MIDRKRILDLLDEGIINASESIELFQVLDAAQGHSKDVERVLGMLAAKQLNAPEAVGLIKALTLSSVLPAIAPAPPAAPSAPTGITGFFEKLSVGRILSIHIRNSNAEDESDVSMNLPLSLGKFVEKFIPKEAIEVVKQQGIDLPDMLGSLNADMPKGELINLNASFAEQEINVRIEVI